MVPPIKDPTRTEDVKEMLKQTGAMAEELQKRETDGKEEEKEE